jgi:hypothetical protein
MRTTWLLLALAAVGCAGTKPPPATPELAVIDFARALNQGRFDEAYARMSEEYRQRVPFEQFKRQLTENPEEAAALSHALSHVKEGTQLEATVRYDDDHELTLRREGEGDQASWFLSSPLVDFYDQSTPRAALRAFVRALERKRYDVVMRLIPNADKEGITSDRLEQAWSGDGRKELERLVHNLSEHLDDPIEVVGDRATMPYGDQMRAQLLRENGIWKVEDPE